ncbi:MAG: acyl-CoA dehydrogenase family protein [Thermodesulfobacteriota bacterium]
MRTGTAEQVRRFGSDFASGDRLAAFCLSEPSFGSDAGSLQTRAEAQSDHYVLNGVKAWITLGGLADYYLVFVRTGPGKRAKGVSALVVEKDTPGLHIGSKELKMDLRGSITAEISFSDARVPKSNLLWGEGQGWRILTEGCNDMRAWGAASMALGIAEGALVEALAYSKTRIQFGGFLAHQQAVQFMLADMKIKTEAVRSLIRRTTYMLDHGLGTAKEIETLVSASKCLASDTAMEITEQAVQIHGALGVRKGSVVERLMRDAKAIQIFDGSNQIQRLIVARNMLI